MSFFSALSSTLYVYDIMLCGCSHMPLHCPRNKIKSRKIDKKKRKSKSNIKV